MAQGLFVILRDWITCFSAIWDIVYFPGGETSHNGLSLGLRPEGGTFFRLQVYESGGDSRVEVYERIAYV